jgi:hypothetical protein
MADPAQTPQRGNWVCPCTGCKKARKQAFAEVLEIIDVDNDTYYNKHRLREKCRQELEKK